MKRLAFALSTVLALLPIAAQAQQPEERTVAEAILANKSSSYFGANLTDPRVMKLTFSDWPITVLVPMSQQEWVERSQTIERSSEMALEHILVGGMYSPQDLSARTQANRGQVALRTAAGTTLFIEPWKTGGFIIRDTNGNAVLTTGPTIWAKNGVILFIDGPLSK